MIISTFKSVQRAYVDLRLDMSWEEICDLLTYHYDVDNKTDVELYNMVDFKTIDYELGRTYHYIGNERQLEFYEIPNTVRRCKNNLVSISGIVLDYDKNQCWVSKLNKEKFKDYLSIQNCTGN